MSEMSKNADPLLSRILTLAKEQGMNQKAFAQQLRINPVTISEWKKGKSASYSDMKMLRNIAAVLKVDVSELIGNNKTPAPGEGSERVQPMNDMERHLIQIARGLDPYRQALLLWMAEAVANKDDPRTPQVLAGVPGLYAGTARAEGRSNP